jgi:DNA-binding transcriptional LysR family regulator
MNLTLRQLRALAAVAELGSFTEAAHRLHLTQAAMSVLVRELETELGVRVLDRTTRQVRLSEAGREFLPSVLRVLNELNAGVANVSSLRDKKRGCVRVAAPQLMSCTLMPQVMQQFRNLYPDVTVQLFDTSAEQVLDRLMTGEVELAVGLDTVTGAELSKRTLLRDRHLLVCRPDHPLAARRRLRWRDLTAYPFIAPTRDFVKELMAELKVAAPNVTITPVHEVSYTATAIGMAAAGLGFTACPSYAARLVKGYRLQMRSLTEPVFSREVCVYNIAAKSLSPAASSFYDILIKVAAENTKPR